MEILFGLFGLLFMPAIGAGVVMVLVFMARKLELTLGKNDDDKSVNQNGEASIKNNVFNIQWLKSSIAMRFGLVAILIILMNIPLDMVKDIVIERSHLHEQVNSEVAATWGHLQRLNGPSLLIPYTERFDTVETLTDKDGNERKKNKTTYKHRTAIVLPEELNIDVSLLGQTRKRSIYEALVYNADVKINGRFKQPNLNELSNNIDEIHWDRAWFSLGISDTQAINKVSKLKWLSLIHI